MGNSTVLVVVHVASADSFMFSFPSASVEIKRIIRSITQRARATSHVIVLDQGWSGPWAAKLRRVLRRAAPRAKWIAHDEDTDGWNDLASTLPDAIDDAGISRVELAGFWLEGCVQEVREILQAAGIPVTVNASLCGSEAFGS